VNWLRVARDGLVIAGIIYAVVFWAFYTLNGGQPEDVRWYWSANPHNLYPHPELAEHNGYNYSPAFEFIVGWGRLLPFEVFVAIWRAMLLAIVVYLAGPLTLFVLLTVPVGSEINAGNIQLLLAFAIYVGFRFPAAWAFVLLTKVSPGVALLWFVLRREWRYLRTVAISTGIVAAASLLLWSDQWPGYLRLITGGAAPAVAPYYLSLWQRLPVAIALVVIGAWRGWRWTVPASACLALPVFYTISPALLVGCLPYLRQATGRWLASRGYSLERAGSGGVAPVLRPNASAG
jgi:hypothetical protein